MTAEDCADSTPRLPRVSVVIPTLNERDHIEACLASVLRQTYPAEHVEVIVADGGSTDGTRAVVEQLGVADRRIRLVDNPRRWQAAGLNLAIAASTGEVVARLDGHAEWPEEHLARCVAVLERTGAACVGGTMLGRSSTPTGEAIALAARSPLGAGGATYRYGQREQEVDTVWLGCYRRDALLGAGLYDERLSHHEDYELNARIRAAGGQIVFSPQLPATYWTRSSYAALARQYFRYGRGKVRAGRLTPGLIRPYHLAPVAVTLALPSLVAAAAFVRGRRVAALSAIAYSTGVGIASGLASRKASLAVAARVPFVFPVMHLSWGLGFIVESALGGPPRSPRA